MMLIVKCDRCSENMFVAVNGTHVCKNCQKSETDSLGGYL